MLCPGCRTPLAEVSNYPRCPRCGGIWTDLETLDRFYVAPPSMELLAACELTMSLEGEHPCPVCRFPLTPMNYRVTSVEACRICEGVWVERAVLLKLAFP